MPKKRRDQRKAHAEASGDVERLEAAVEELEIEDSGKQEVPISKPDTEPKTGLAAELLTPPSTPLQEPGSVKKKTQLLRRPNLGRAGQPIQLYANFYPVKTKEGMKVYHYDLTVFRKQSASKPGRGAKPKRCGQSEPGQQPAPDGYTHVARMPRFLAVLIMKKLYETHSRVFGNKYGVVFDGQKNLITTYVLAGIPLEKNGENGGANYDVVINNPEKSINEEFRVRIKFAATVCVNLKEVFSRDLQERKSVATLIYDLVLKQAYFFNMDQYIPENRRIFYYPSPLDSFPLGDGVYRFPGFWQSLRPVQGWKVMINIDQANTAFVKGGKLIDTLATDFKVPPNSVNDRNIKQISLRLEKLVKGIKVTQLQRLVHRTAKCNGVTRTSARDTTFPVELPDGQRTTMSVAQYFDQQYRSKEFVQPLKYPNLPCLKLGSKRLIPLEFCEIKAGQRYPRKLNSGQTSAMLKVASQPANQRKRLIEEDVDYLKINENPYMKEFGLSITTQMVQLAGRVLPAATVQFANQQITPDKGGWNMRDAKVVSGKQIREFAVLCTTQNCRQDDVTNFIREWRKSAQQMGITVVKPQASWMAMELDENNMEARLKEAKQRVGVGLDLVFVILDGQNTQFYANVKQAGDVKLGISTQCIQVKNVQLAKPATMANINLKINGKLGGINSKLQQDLGKINNPRAEPILYLGADVNHTSPDDSEEPVSCAAVVGNVDINPSVFCARIFLQSQERTEFGSTVGRRNQEYIGQLTEGVQMAIELFMENNGILPRRIIMFRDGVGETMFQMVLERELSQIHEACERVERRYPNVVKKCGFKAYRPPVTFIVVQKRHHTRLFCVNERDAMFKNGYNVPPGTTVDTTIVHPEEFDFYLCSHLGLQGTSKPAHYHVLSDDSNYSADDLQRMIYNLCHTYCRSTRTVSIPPPCYYADLVAYRARQYLKSMQRSDVESVSSASSVAVNLTELQRLVNVNDSIVKKGMYFI